MPALYQNRRKFIRNTSLAGIGLGLSGRLNPLFSQQKIFKGKKVGIIGLDTSHSIAFTKELNGADAENQYAGYKVVAAYPYGSKDIESSASRIPGYISEMKTMGVEITSSIQELLNKADVVLLETNDGRLHLEQALQVIKAGKPVFIDKPLAASLADAAKIFKQAQQNKVPVFSSSSLRFMPSAQEVVNGKIGKVLGADCYSPAQLEPTHPDFFWYGIHGIETLFTVMGKGCKQVSRSSSPDADVVVGLWEDGRLGTFRGTRSGKHLYGGTAFGENGNALLGPFESYKPLLKEIINFFETGKLPVTAEETLEICAFIEAADESKRQNGATITLESMRKRAGIAS